ncbi:MAG TPA: M24 family metallopeptidase [Phototrophicaceae bacterium]|jgi:Xaa-Pro aminopeptidase|nr:M24 family metallopeptidase [Phototrophicaceae bacterium]
MKADIDRLMAARGFDAIVVVVDEFYSPYVDYLVGHAHITGGMIFKHWQNDPVLVVNPMEVEEARASGYTVYTTADLGYAQFIKEVEGDVLKANVALWGKCLEKFGIPNGRIGIYGVGSVEYYLELIRALEATYPQHDFVGESGTTLFDEAAFTKDDAELRRIQSVAERTSAVVRATWDFIAGHRAGDNDAVLKRDDTPLTIGEVKRFVRKALMDRDLEDTGMIFAQGRDAGFPHSRGQDDQPLLQGESIVFDLFPRELGGGYYHDMTRTWCIGYAPDDVREAYHHVMESFDVAVEMMVVGRPAREVQEAVQSYFEGRRHHTSRSHPGTSEGYVHSLGHGVGLNIHESYSMSHLNQNDKIEVGNMLTIEPGLYYPNRGFGVRIEDMVYVGKHGQLITLTDVPKDLILPLRG